MEVEFDADLVASDEESSAALVRRSFKGNSRRNLKENKLKGRVNPDADAEINGSFEESSGALVGRSSNVSFGSKLEENEANDRVKPETEVDRNTSMTMIRNFEPVENVQEKLGSEGFEAANAEVKLGSKGFGATNAEVKLGSQEFEAAKPKVAESSEVSEDERARWRENKEVINGNGGSDSSACPRRMGPSNELDVAAIPTNSHPEAPFGPSVYYAEDEGSESNVFLDGGGKSIDYESQKTEFEKSDRVIQTTIEIKNNQKWTNTEGNLQRNCMDLETSIGAYVTQSFITEEISHIEKTEKGKNVLIEPHAYSEIGSAATVRNGELTINDVEKAESEGIKQHQNGNSVSEFVLKDSHHRFLSAQDETQLKEHWTRILEKSSLEGKVEDIVKILKEQQSHDLLCPVCGSCITKRVVLRKRKRISLVSYDRWHEEVNGDEQGPVSEEEHEATEAQNKQPMSNEDSEESEAYGCLACFSLFFRRVAGVKHSQAKSQSSNNSLIEEHLSENVKKTRDLVDREKESIYCLPFLYPWGQSVNRESNAAGVRADFAAESSQQKTLKEAESRLQIKHSASSLGIADTLQQKKAHSKASANVVTESILTHEGKRTTMINKVHQNEDNTDMEDGKLDSQLNLGALSRKNHDVRADFAVGTSQQKREKEVETTSKIMPSTSNFEVVDTLQQTKPVSEESNANIVTGSILIHNGQKATLVNKADHNEDICTGNDKLDSKLNLEAVYSKDQVEESTRKTGHLDIRIQNSRYQTSTTTKRTSKDSKSMENVGITETQYRESKQFEEHYPMNEAQLKMPPSSSIPSLEGQTGEVGTNNEIPDESASLKESDKPVQQHRDELAELQESEKQHLYQEDVKRREDQLTEQLSNEEHEPVKTEQLSGIETIKALGMSPKEIESSMHEDGIRPYVVTQDQVSNKSSAAEGEEELTISEQQQDSLKENKAVRQNESYSKDYICSCIPVSLPAWSLWSAKKSITDQELKKPLLPNIKDKETFDKAPVPSKGDSERELILPMKPDSVDSTSSLEKQDPSTLAQSKVDDSVPHRSEISSDSGKTVISTHDPLDTIVEVHQTDDLQPSNVITAVSQLTSTSTQVQGPNVVTEWDLLKSIVYGGLVVSITSLGVVSSAAGGEAETLTVVAIALANLLSGLLLIVNNILDLHYYHPDQFKETVGHRFWFNGFVAIISYLVFGSLAPITYCFSFQRSDDKLYKFLATSLVSLVSIISLALGKAQVTNKSYIRITTLYVVTGFGASIIGFFAGEYIKKLLAKWGLTTD